MQDAGLLFGISLLIYAHWWPVMLPLSIASGIVGFKARSPLLTVWLLSTFGLIATWMAMQFSPGGDSTGAGYVGLFIPAVVPFYVLISYTIGALLDRYARGLRFRIGFERV